MMAMSVNFTYWLIVNTSTHDSNVIRNSLIALPAWHMAVV